nr:hypothetical protein [Pantoea sp. 201603H]
MTITAEEVIYGLGLLVSQHEEESDAYIVNVNEARALLAHIDAQAARIEKTESRYNEVSGWYCKMKTRMLAAEKELTSLRDEVSTWEKMRRANKLPETIGATILYAASLKLERAELREQKPVSVPDVKFRWVELDALSAACGALQRYAPDGKTLALLRRYTFGDLSQITPAPVAVPVAEKLHEMVSAVRSINRAPHHIAKGVDDDEPCYWQRKEWIDWMLELCNQADDVLRLNSGSKSDD